MLAMLADGFEFGDESRSVYARLRNDHAVNGIARLTLLDSMLEYGSNFLFALSEIDFRLDES